MDELEQDERYTKLVQDMRDAFLTGRTKDLKFRKEQLQRLLDLIEENYNELYEALKEDMHKPLMEVMLTELGFLQREIRYALWNLRKWAKPTSIPMHLTMPTDSIYVHHDPFGVVLIVAPWNYMHLVFSPLIGAIAAGNCAVLKPSEVSLHCEAVVAKLVPKYLDNQCYKVITGGPKEMTLLLKQKYDYIFYTGSFIVGQIMHAAANKYLTPVTLELGGKCPVFIDDTASFYKCAQRIMWGKNTNAGQSCVAPDYILCTKDVETRMVAEFKKVLQEFYGNNCQETKDFARIINSRHWNRLKTLLTRSKGTVVIGGEMDEYDLYISPTVIADVAPTDSLMEGELFGPLLPIISINSVHDAISFINGRDKPLVVYVFTKKTDVIDEFKKNTQSGALDVNDCMYHYSVFDVPFGGIGESGMGRYHGKWSFDTFSYDRAVVQRKFSILGNWHSFKPRYPPYTPGKYKFLFHGLRYFDHFYIDIFKYLPHCICFILGALLILSGIYFNLFEL